jgi:hypothetical protein
VRVPGQSLLLVVACSALACEERNDERLDRLRPRPTVSMVPADLTSAVGPAALQVLVDNAGNAVGPAMLEAIAASVRLVTWPEDAPIPATTSAEDFEPRRDNNEPVYGSAVIRVTPASPLEERWYFLHLDRVPSGAATAGGGRLAELADGRVGARFAWRPTR